MIGEKRITVFVIAAIFIGVAITPCVEANGVKVTNTALLGPYISLKVTILGIGQIDDVDPGTGADYLLRVRFKWVDESGTTHTKSFKKQYPANTDTITDPWVIEEGNPGYEGVLISPLPSSKSRKVTINLKLWDEEFRGTPFYYKTTLNINPHAGPSNEQKSYDIKFCLLSEKKEERVEGDYYKPRCWLKYKVERFLYNYKPVECEAHGPTQGKSDKPLNFWGDAWNGIPPYEYRWVFDNKDEVVGQYVTWTFHSKLKVSRHKAHLAVWDYLSNYTTDDLIVKIVNDTSKKNNENRSPQQQSQQKMLPFKQFISHINPDEKKNMNFNKKLLQRFAFFKKEDNTSRIFKRSVGTTRKQMKQIISRPKQNDVVDNENNRVHATSCTGDTDVGTMSIIGDSVDITLKIENPMPLDQDSYTFKVKWVFQEKSSCPDEVWYFKISLKDKDGKEFPGYRRSKKIMDKLMDTQSGDGYLTLPTISKFLLLNGNYLDLYCYHRKCGEYTRKNINIYFYLLPEPKLGVEPTSLIWENFNTRHYKRNPSNAPTQEFTVSNIGEAGSVLSVTIHKKPSWVTLSPDTSFKLYAGEKKTIVVQPVVSQLKRNTHYNGNIELSSNGGDATVRLVLTTALTQESDQKNQNENNLRKQQHLEQKTFLNKFFSSFAPRDSKKSFDPVKLNHFFSFKQTDNIWRHRSREGVAESQLEQIITRSIKSVVDRNNQFP